MNFAANPSFQKELDPGLVSPFVHIKRDKLVSIEHGKGRDVNLYQSAFFSIPKSQELAEVSVNDLVVRLKQNATTLKLEADPSQYWVIAIKASAKTSSESKQVSFVLASPGAKSISIITVPASELYTATHASPPPPSIISFGQNWIKQTLEQEKKKKDEKNDAEKKKRALKRQSNNLSNLASTKFAKHDQADADNLAKKLESTEYKVQLLEHDLQYTKQLAQFAIESAELRGENKILTDLYKRQILPSLDLHPPHSKS